MQNIVKMVSEKTGLSETQAKSAVDTVVSYIKDKLPGGIGNQVESFINTGSTGTNPTGNLQNQAQNTAGNVVNKAQDTAENLKDKTQSTSESLKDKAEDAIDNIKDKIGGMFGK